MRSYVFLGVLAAAGALALAGLWPASVSGGACPGACGVAVQPMAGEGPKTEARPAPKCECKGCELAKEQAGKLADAVKALDSAKKAVEGGDNKTALAELGKARDLVAAAQAALEKKAAVPTGVVNAKCPIMGTAIDPAKVPESLIREFKGKKVGFCCSACPGAWDNLTDEQKEQKLQAATGGAEKK